MFKKTSIMAQIANCGQKSFTFVTLDRGHFDTVLGLEDEAELKKHGSQQADVFKDGIKNLVTYAKGVNINAIATLLLSNWYHIHK